MSALLREVEVRGRRTDVLVRDGVIAAVGAGLAPEGAAVIDGAGGALLPGLHDHHLHLLALAASWTSVRCGPDDVAGADDLARALGNAPPAVDGWVRATGYHESVAGPLDRQALDRLLSYRPVRVQHRSGSLWMLNSAALAAVGPVLDRSADVERDEHGEPTGRLWRYDARLRRALPSIAPDLGAVGRRLASYGITGVTDATPDLDPGALSLITDAAASGALPQRVTLLGAPLGERLAGPLTTGPCKVLLRDHDLPAFDDLAAAVTDAHALGRGVAVHCVTRESLVLTLTVIDEVGARPDDRIEHAAVVPPDLAAWMARLGLRVVTQPDFLRTRGATYRREVDPDDLPHLYPYAGLLASGVRTCASSDAPYGEVDPWRVMASAASRLDGQGRALGPAERVPTATALAGYLSPPADPGGRPRTVHVGAAADLVLLGASLADALAEPDSQLVRQVWVGGTMLRT